MKIELRDYQDEAIKSIYSYWSEKKGKFPCCTMSTGSGKSIIIGKVMYDVVSAGDRCIMLTHQKELIQQNADKFADICPDVDYGIFSAGLNKRELYKPVLFAGIQSIHNKIHYTDGFDLCIIDECHLISPRDGTRYKKCIEMLLKMRPNMKILGLTATNFRLDGGYLHKNKDIIFDGVCYETNIVELIDKGYLSNVISKGGIKNIDLTGVKHKNGEFDQTDLAFAASDPALVESAVNEMITYGHDRKSWLVFCSGIEHAKIVTESLKSKGINTKLLTGSTENKKRESIIADYKAGKIRCITNVNVMSTGVDVPSIDLIGLMTATESTVKFVQCVGRGLRTAPGKKNCLLLDWGSNCERHGCIDAVIPNIKVSTGEKKEAPAKECPQCRSKVHASQKECPECGYVWTPAEFIHDAKAFSGAVLSNQIKPKVKTVDKVTYSRNIGKGGKPDCVKIGYICGGIQYNMFLCVEHQGYPHRKAKEWIKKHGGSATTTQEILDECSEYPVPLTVEVIKKPGAKYFEVIGANYE